MQSGFPCRTVEDFLQVFLEVLQGGNALGSRWQGFLFVNKNLLASALNQRPQAFAHAPAHVSQDLQPFGPGHQKRDAVISQHTDGLGKAIESLQVESGSVKLLELFGWIRHQNWIAKTAIIAKIAVIGKSARIQVSS